MEASPNPTRQRNRRSDRYAQQDAPAPVQIAAVPLPRALQSRPQQPVNSAPRSGQQTYAPSYQNYSSRPYVPAPPALTNRPSDSPAAPPRRQPLLMDEPVRQEEEMAAERRMPGWMIGTMTGMFLLVMALIAAMYMMQAYLKTQADAREAAWREVLSNYHVLDGNDGTMSVTYQDAIEYYAAENNLQPAFVTAIIRNESSFRTQAESGVGARGLMQLMPDTSEWIAGKLDMDGFHFDMMYDAETNIRFGCWYLGYLSKLFRGDPVLVAAAYHAGQSTVTGWLSDKSMSADGVTIPLEKLVDGPTKTYAGRVTQAYGIYQALLYPEQRLHGEISSVSADGPAAVRAPVIER